MSEKELKDESLNFIIDRTYPTLNEYILECRKHKIKGAEFKQNDENWTSMYISSLRLPTVPDEWYPLKISFHFYEKNTRRDLDNVMGYAHKIILDALQDTILKQDNWSAIRQINDEFDVDKNNPRIEITLQPYFNSDGTRPVSNKMGSLKSKSSK